MKRILKMRCQSCGRWNRVPTDKIFIEQKVMSIQTFIPFYKPLKVAKCKKCGKTIASPDELIRIREKESASIN